MSVRPVIYRFSGFELDPSRFELRQDGEVVKLEPQVLSLLILLAGNAERMVSRDEIVEKIWGGRIVSEAAISARVKAARAALGDSGKEQRFIRTVHGRGFRFVAPMETRLDLVVAAAGMDEEAPAVSQRPSIAVLPFALHGEAGAYGFLAEAVPEEIIADLARLRWLSVIARGTSFRFQGAAADPLAVGQALGVRYCVSGSVTATGLGWRLAVELVDAHEGAVVWNDAAIAGPDEVELVRRDLVSSVVAAIDREIPMHEAMKARGRPQDSLDAWSSYYLGYDLLFRFNGHDNAAAQQHLERALALDPTLARAHAGLSFAHHQNFFMKYQPDAQSEMLAARSFARQALELDRGDPFCHFNMGRSAWVEGRLMDSVEWLDRATELSPSYAQGLYAKAWAQTLAGEHEAGEGNAREALRLSPLDPLRYAMLGTVALARMGEGDSESAAAFGEKSARSPGAHKYIALIAAIVTQDHGDRDAALRWLGRAREMDPAISGAMFLESFPFAEGAMREKVAKALRELGV